jgi:hypothetical protein
MGSAPHVRPPRLTLDRPTLRPPAGTLKIHRRRDRGHSRSRPRNRDRWGVEAPCRADPKGLRESVETDHMPALATAIKAHTRRRFAYLLVSLLSALTAFSLLVISTISIMTQRQFVSIARQHHLTYSADFALPVLGLVLAVVLVVISFVAARRRLA